MTDQNDCQFESKVVSAIRSGAIPHDLTSHITTCASCREIAAVAGALHEMAEETQVPTSLPNYRLIWLKAQVLQNQRRVARLELLGKLGTVAAVLLAVATIAIWNWLGSSTNQHTAQTITDWQHTLKMAAPLMIALVVLFGVNNVRAMRRRDRWL